MADKVSLIKLLGKEKLERIERIFRKHFQLGLETGNTQGKEIKQMCSADCRPTSCRIVQSSTFGRSRCNKERRRSLEIAIETGQSYISLCHAGVVLVRVPIMDKDKALGGIFFGKCLWEHATQILINDVEKRLNGIRVNRKKLTAATCELPFIQGRKIYEAAQFLFDLLYEAATFDPQVIRWRRERSEQQSQIGEFIQERKKLGTEWHYPLESERELGADGQGQNRRQNRRQGDSQFHTRDDIVQDYRGPGNP